MTKSDKNFVSEGVTPRQQKAIPYLVSSPTWEEGRKNARVSRDTLFRWLKEPAFKSELDQARELVIREALNTLKAAMTKAADTLVGLLSSEAEAMRRGAANDILSWVLKVKELEEFEQVDDRLKKLEATVFRR